MDGKPRFMTLVLGSKLKLQDLLTCLELHQPCLWQLKIELCDQV